MKPLDLIRAHEGLRLHVYSDVLMGAPTIGYGQRLDDLTPDQAQYLTLKYSTTQPKIIDLLDAERLLELKVDTLIKQISVDYPWYNNLSVTRQAVILDMFYEMGYTGMSKWETFLGYMAQGDYPAAVVDMLKTLWAKQVPARAKNDAHLMSVGG